MPALNYIGLSMASTFIALINMASLSHSPLALCWVKMKYILFLLIIISANLYSTDRFYKDLKEKSENSEYHIQAKSKDNESDKPRAFQENFTYTLRRKNGEILWVYTQKKDESSPCELYVSNGGIVIVIDAGDNVCKFDRIGNRMVMCDILDKAISNEHIKKYCENTTAGIFWDQFSIKEFADIDGDTVFYIRTYWGQYIIVPISKNVANVNIDKVLENRNLEKYIKIISEAKSSRGKCKSCGNDCFSLPIQISIFILRLHSKEITNEIVKEIITGNDNHSPSVNEFINKLP